MQPTPRRAWALLTSACLFLACVATGCAHQPTPAEIASADYGAFPVHYEAIVAQFMVTILKDPMSAQYASWKGPSTLWYRRFTQSTFGYRVCAQVNAKNSYGGYNGFTSYFFMIRNGTVAQYSGGSDLGRAHADSMCAVQ